MKAKGITVYTVGFDVGGMTRRPSRRCRSARPIRRKYYNADDGEQLKQAFRDIALKLSSLYISK